MTHPQEQYNREVKATKLYQTLLELSEGDTELVPILIVQIEKDIGPRQGWRMVAEVAHVNEPSTETVEMVRSIASHRTATTVSQDTPQ